MKPPFTVFDNFSIFCIFMWVLLKNMCDSDCGKGVKLLSGPFNWYSTWFSGVEPKIHFPKVGESATFTCNATGIPSQNFTWTKLGSKVEIINDSRHSVDFLTGSSVLTIKIITVEDQAYYICNATVDDDQQNLGLAYLQPVSGKLYHVLSPKNIQKIRNYISYWSASRTSL